MICAFKKNKDHVIGSFFTLSENLITYSQITSLSNSLLRSTNQIINIVTIQVTVADQVYSLGIHCR